MLITEVIPKKQENPITQALMEIDGYKCLLNFNPNEMNLGASGLRGVAVYSKKNLQVAEVDIPIDGFDDHAWIEIPIVKVRQCCVDAYIGVLLGMQMTPKQ